jgi:membrane fusion protein (multidrug efflux system)
LVHFRSLRLLLLGLAFASVAAAQPAGKPPAGKPMAMPVRMAAVSQTVVTNAATAVGNLIANESVVIRPEIAGRVTAIHFREGERVAAGAKLVSIDSAEVEAQRAASDADRVLNQQRYDRAAELYRKNFISSQALDEARANLARSKARMAEDDARLRKSEVKAPFAGTLGLRLISPGAYVKAGDDIVRLEDTSVMKVDFRIPETFLARLRRNQEVTLQVDAYPGRSFTGRTYAFESSIDEKTRTVLVRARVPNADGTLKPGMFARVSLVLESIANALVVPEEALVPRGGQMFVFKVVDGKALLTPIETGSRTPGQVQIVKGLAADDRVVTEGHQKLQNGMMVIDASKMKPAPAPPGAGASAQANK